MSRDGSCVLSRRHTSLLIDGLREPTAPFLLCVQAFLVALILDWTTACMLMFGHSLYLCLVLVPKCVSGVAGPSRSR